MLALHHAIIWNQVFCSIVWLFSACLFSINNTTVNYTQTIKNVHTCQIFITNQVTSSGLVCYDSTAADGLLQGGTVPTSVVFAPPLCSVLVTRKYSDPAHLRYGVPQGSVLGPALFSDYISPFASLIRSFEITAHCYADDTQLYVPFTPGIDEEEVRNKLEDCIDAVRVWMNKNRLKLNYKKLSSSYLALLLD